MYAAGLIGKFDALGAHANTQAPDPLAPLESLKDFPHPSFYFRRIEQLRQTMVDNGQGQGTLTITFQFDQLEPGNSLCVTLLNLGKNNTMTCTQVKKFPTGLSGDFGRDVAEATAIGTLGAAGSATDRAFVNEDAFDYKAVQYVFSGTIGDQMRATCAVAAPR